MYTVLRKNSWMVWPFFWRAGRIIGITGYTKNQNRFLPIADVHIENQLVDLYSENAYINCVKKELLSSGLQPGPGCSSSIVL